MRIPSLIVLVIAATASCSRRPGPQPTPSADGTAQARALLARLHEDNQTELRIAEVGRDKAQTPAVQDYAARLRTDSTTADAKVARYADEHGITLPGRAAVHGRQAYGSGQPGGAAAPSRAAHSPEQKIERVHQLRDDDDFDREFLVLSLQDHAEQQRTLEATPRADDPELRALADETQATLRAHQTAARELLATPPAAAQGRRPR